MAKRSDIIVPLCKKREYSKLHYAKVDQEIAPLVAMLNLLGVETLGACSGHNKYKPTIIFKKNNQKVEYFSDKIILRKKRFYIKDKEGYYFIPELKNR